MADGGKVIRLKFFSGRRGMVQRDVGYGIMLASDAREYKHPFAVSAAEGTGPDE